MCLRVRFARNIISFYDADHGIITVPAGLSPYLTLRAIRGALAGLCIRQDDYVPRCWCGEPVSFRPHVPAQRTEEVMSRGA